MSKCKLIKLNDGDSPLMKTKPFLYVGENTCYILIIYISCYKHVTYLLHICVFTNIFHQHHYSVSNVGEGNFGYIDVGDGCRSLDVLVTS